MLLRESIDLFLEKNPFDNAEAPAKAAKLRKELKRLLRHCEAQNDPCQTVGLSGEIIASYLSNRTKKASGRPRKSTIHALRIFFEFLRQEKFVETDLAASLPARAETKNKAEDLLHQLQTLEETLLDLERLELSRKKIAKIKQAILKIARADNPAAVAALDLGGQKLAVLQHFAKAELEKKTPELFEAGGQKIPELGNLLAELNDLTKNVTRLGKEQYKVQTAIDAKQQREAVFFDELQRRLARYERLLEDLSGLKQDLSRQISLEIIKELLPVIDGLENALALSSSLNGKPVPAKPEKNFLRRFFAASKPLASASAPWASASAPVELAPMNVQHWVAGMEIIRDRLLALFKKSGVTPIPSLGEKFDPQFHLAVAAESHNDAEPNAILKEQLRGYRRGEEIVRFAEVVVAR